MDYALRALNGAREALRPEFYPVHYDREARAFRVRYTCRAGSPTSEIGIFSIGGGEAVRAIKAELGALGYEVREQVLKSEDYGVPQERRRVVFIGNRVGAPISHPAPTHGPGLEPFTTIKDAIGDLPPVGNGENRGRVPYLSGKPSPYQRMMRGKAATVSDHAAPKLGAVNIERLAHIPPGGSWRDIAFDLLPAGMKRAKRSDHTKRYGRMTWDGLSCTVLTKRDIQWRRRSLRWRRFPSTASTRFSLRQSRTCCRMRASP